ncbi:MAG TPA: coenzyme F420-0:L-glutamate ligase [Propionibacteriaceae bacterium]|nr:coenzyme F420-0:L-glutamate ligase [Propionibacteriaceae bacterium]
MISPSGADQPASAHDPSAITIFAPAGIGEVMPGADLGAVILAAIEADPRGPLQDGDVVVVTSKIISKAEGRVEHGSRRAELISSATRRTVARRGETRIVRTYGGLTVAAAGIDRSNVSAESILLLPRDADASAAELHQRLVAATGRRLGVVVSDTAGRPWRMGQTDHAIGICGVRALDNYAGRWDAYGNELQITAMAVADELAAAADLVKGKLRGRPVAVVRGLEQLVAETDSSSRELLRDETKDMFSFGSQEAVLAAALAATGQQHRYEELLALDASERTTRLLAGTSLGPEAAALLRTIMSVDLVTGGTQQFEIDSRLLETDR